MKTRFWRDVWFALLTFVWTLSAIATGVGLVANFVWGEFDLTLLYIGIGGACLFVPISMYLWRNPDAREWIFMWLMPF